ncbi:MAG: NAD(P)H-binding protein [Rubrivivax sp.]|nr:NAD(P)H-binding protein [Rubrivivax sp.]
MLLLGSTGTIGRATLKALQQRGHEVLSVVRAPVRSGAAAATATAPPTDAATATAPLPAPATAAGRPVATLTVADLTEPGALSRALARLPPAATRFDVLVSCLASRTGVPRDAWAVDHGAHQHALTAARAAGVGQVVLLSALCVQKPRLAFQHAKLAFERTLIDTGLRYSIVRPTAFFKSLSGQVGRVQKGKPFLLFGDGCLTACKPIADEDLAEYLVDCIDNPARQNCILPIGGPGPAITPREQGEALFKLLDRAPRFKSVPVALLDGLAAVLGAAGRVLPPLAAKAELARIGRYYATESMLVWDAAQQRYDAEATPSTGQRTLLDHYAQLLRGEVVLQRGDHAVF